MMVDYTKTALQDKVGRFGEVFIVLDSDREYQCHGTEQLQFVQSHSAEEVRLEGFDGDGEWVIAEFPLDAIEHVYTHREI